jgi:hypothetical protein
MTEGQVVNYHTLGDDVASASESRAEGLVQVAIRRRHQEPREPIALPEVVMKHIQKEQWMGCAVATAAMFGDLDYEEISEHRLNPMPVR